MLARVIARRTLDAIGTKRTLQPHGRMAAFGVTDIAQNNAHGSASDAKRLLLPDVGVDSDKGIYRNHSIRHEIVYNDPMNDRRVSGLLFAHPTEPAVVS
jgi:hypothetical protein